MFQGGETPLQGDCEEFDSLLLQFNNIELTTNKRRVFLNLPLAIRKVENMSEERKQNPALMRILEKIKETTGKDLTDKIDKVKIVELNDEDVGDLSEQELLERATTEISDETADAIVEALGNEPLKPDTIIANHDAVDGWEFRTILPMNDAPTVTTTYHDKDFCASYSFSLADRAMFYFFDSKSGYNITISHELKEDVTQDDFKNAIAILNKHIHSVIDVYNYRIITPDAQDMYMQTISEFLDKMRQITDLMDRETSS